MGITVVPRQTEDNAYAKFGGAKRVHYGRCANDELENWWVLIRLGKELRT